MRHGVGVVGHGPFQRFLRFKRCGAFGGLAGFQVPHLPWGKVQQRLDIDRAQVQMVGLFRKRRPHGVGKVVVPAMHVLDRFALRIARGQGADQGLFDWQCSFPQLPSAFWVAS